MFLVKDEGTFQSPRIHLWIRACTQFHHVPTTYTLEATEFAKKAYSSLVTDIDLFAGDLTSFNYPAIKD